MKNRRKLRCYFTKWLGGTLDDAAGECFDKTARLLGFGHGGGVAIQEAAKKRHPGLDPGSIFKTLDSGSPASAGAGLAGMTNAFACEVQEAITDVLVTKTLKAAQIHRAKSILLSGGVAANTRLREKLKLNNAPFTVKVPSPALCTDNAVMIAACAFFRGKPADWHEVTAIPDLSVET